MESVFTEITIHLYDAQPRVVPAVQFGQVAVHLEANYDADEDDFPRYMITHVASGLSITPFLMRRHLNQIPVEAVFELARRCSAIDFDVFWKSGKTQAPDEYIVMTKLWDKEFQLGIW